MTMTTPMTMPTPRHAVTVTVQHLAFEDLCSFAPVLREPG